MLCDIIRWGILWFLKKNTGWLRIRSAGIYLIFLLKKKNTLKKYNENAGQNKKIGISGQPKKILLELSEVKEMTAKAKAGYLTMLFVLFVFTVL